MFKYGLLGSAVVVMFLGYGCATTKLARPVVSYETREEVARRWNEALVPSRLTPVRERGLIVDEIDMRINSAAVKVCQRTFGNPQDCPGFLGQRTLHVVSDDNDPNAYVGKRFDITVLGGLVYVAGNDDEIAFVLAHEYSCGQNTRTPSRSAICTFPRATRTRTWAAPAPETIWLKPAPLHSAGFNQPLSVPNY